MVLLNASKRARMVSSTVNMDQGGGNTKSGLPSIIGRSASTSMYLGKKTGGCTIVGMQFTRYPNTNESRPIGISAQNPRLI